MYKTIFFMLVIVAIAAASPILYNAYAPGLSLAPYNIHTGYSVIRHLEPVEQHGYSIAY